MVSERHFKRFIKDKYIYIAAIAGVVLFAIAFGIVYVNILPLHDNIVLHLDAVREIDAKTDGGAVVAIFGGMALMFLLNMAIAFRLYYREKGLSYFLAYASVWVLFVWLIAFGVITALN